jgi:putative exosortase-associated protein (TIGR04073 family)
MRIRSLSIVLLLFALSFLGTEQKALAGSIQTVDDAGPQEVVDGMANKLARGVTNVATGWLEFPKQIRLTYQEEGLAKAIAVGPLKGVGMTLVRTFSGAGEALTFFVAYPGFFDPFFDPAYVWQKE